MPTIDNWRALREALDAGPTEGERFIQDTSPWTDAEGKFVQFEAFNISAGSADRSSEDYYRIASVSNINDAPCNKANAMLFAAAHPAATRSLLDERDRLAAEVEALRAEVLAERERLAEVVRDMYREAKAEMHDEDAKTWYYGYCDGLDAASNRLRAQSTDAAMKGKP